MSSECSLLNILDKIQGKPTRSNIRFWVHSIDLLSFSFAFLISLCLSPSLGKTTAKKDHESLTAQGRNHAKRPLWDVKRFEMWNTKLFGIVFVNSVYT